MMLPSAGEILFQRHLAFAHRQRLLSQATGPSLNADPDWPTFWEHVNRTLHACGYARSTRDQFRRVLRTVRQAGIRRPTELTQPKAQRFVHDLAESGASWSWISLHITALRTVFDRLCGTSIADGMVTPKRGVRLPEILSESEAERLVRAGETIRDQLLLGLMVGCGLTGTEAIALRWRDVLDEGQRLHIARSTRYMERVLSVPDAFRDLLQAGTQTCDSDQHVFRGRSGDAHLSIRMVQIIVRRARERAGIEKPICVTTLRHSYAVHRLESGISLPQVQAELGHASIRTTERYLRCIAPKVHSHPFSKVRQRMRAYEPTLGAALPNQQSSPPTRVCPPHPSRAPLSTLKTIDIRHLRVLLESAEPLSPATAFFRLLKNRLFGGILKRIDTHGP